MTESNEQKAILGVLPQSHERPITVAEIFKRLGVTKPTASQRASMSRSLTRLSAKALVGRYVPGRYRPGKGCFWARA